MTANFFSFFKRTDAATQAEPLQAVIERARALHAAGDLEAALAIYRNVLASHPDSAEAHYRLANVLKDQGALEAAVAGYTQAIALKPDDARALCNRAVVLGQLQRLPEALSSYDRALKVDPNDAIVHCNRGMLLNAMGQKSAALDALDAAVACTAAFAPAHFARGALLQEQHHWLASLASYDTAVKLDPNNVVAHFNRATVLRQLERWTEALAGYDRAIALNAEFAQAHSGRAESLQQLNRLEEALDSYDRAITLNLSDATTHGGRGVVLQKAERFDAAMASYHRAIDLDPNDAQAHFNRGTLEAELQNLERAAVDYRRAIAINPKFAEAHLNLALAALKAGDYASGWAHYEWRWRNARGPILMNERVFPEPLWLGEYDIAGRTILLYGEQGLGDSLQFCRFAQTVSELGARVLLEVPRPLSSICATLSGVTQVISHGDPLPEFDLRIPLMSLPLALKSTLETIPANIPYLKSDPDKVLTWKCRLGAKSKPRIGLTWSGSQGSRTFSPRSYALAILIPHLPVEFEYFCLQTEITSADEKMLTLNPAIRRFDGDLKDFSDTAALCECLDLVVTMDTSVAHLNAALGKMTWVLLPYNGDWRWLANRDDSPWYPTARLFRQKSRGDWDRVFQRIAVELRSKFE